MADKILLKDGCHMSTPSVNPKNWKSGGRSLLKKDWQIQYYFFDPVFERKYPYGKLIVVKGMNSYKSIPERRTATKVIIEDEVEKIRLGYNPITKKFVVDDIPGNSILRPDLYFIDAFKLALKNFNYTDRHVDGVAGYINRLEKAAMKLKLTHVSIDDLRRRELKAMLDYLNLSDYTYNKFRSYIGSLFTELIEYECCETNLCRDIRKKKPIKNKREVLSSEDLAIVMAHLKKNNYPFWRFCQIFMYSGARISELMRLKIKDIDLKNQEFTVTIKKGGQSKVIQKVIFKEILPLWDEIMANSKPKDYLFSKGLVPGKENIGRDKIRKRWYLWVKGPKYLKMKVTADIYSLKHSFLDSLPTETAMKVASHTNTETTLIYQVNKAKRDREALKNIDVSLH